jgi:hypothetical protein
LSLFHPSCLASLSGRELAQRLGDSPIRARTTNTYSLYSVSSSSGINDSTILYSYSSLSQLQSISYSTVGLEISQKTHTSWTVLNSSLEARALGTSPVALDGFPGGGGGPCLAMRDLRISKNCWTCSVVTICDDVWFVGDVCMATTALTMSINSWALLNVTTCSDGGRFGLLGGVLGCASATEVLAWVISVRTIVNVKDC